ncbi:hypothetical protein [Dokdonia sp. Hel_I_53]|uniref:hypothetical protein n=1 Tax=Dokdonia sp. Hel_I_53 TaxID=1566287 RepID=UPI001647E456|nr:hypothetical protein [Dokdonia sp. Hel_I_53]
MSTQKPTALFWIVAIVALLWNVMGLSAFLMDAFAPEISQASYTAEQIEMAASAPLWYKIAYGIATITGFLASLMLVARKTYAVPLFLVSLIASIVHAAYIIISIDGVNNFGLLGGLIFPLIVVLLGLFFWWFSKYSLSKGWIK